MTQSYDAIVIGAGHNGLVAATYLARAGWQTLVLEREPRPGGAVLSDELTRPGLVHDVFATNMNLFRGSPVAAELGAELERHGLAYATCALPFANVFPDGRALRVHQDRDATLAELRARDPRDADGWEALDREYERLAPALFRLYGSRLTTGALARAALELVPALGRDGVASLGRLLVSSTRELADTHLASREAKALLACWGMHLDFGPDVSGGAMFPLLEAFTDMRTGISLARGGASRLIDALVALLGEAGGELRLDAEVTRVVVAGGRASAVELAGGERIEARRAVIANLTPTILHGRLLDAAALSPRLRRSAAGYAYGPGTMMVHLALSAPVPWSAGEDIGRFAYVHVAPYLDDLATMYAQASAGVLPAEPMLVVGQTSAVDPSRSPDASQVVWVQVRALPGTIAGDALGEISARDWDGAAEPYAERVMAKLERYAPGIGGLVLDRAVLSPAELERRNPNLVGGDSIAGSMHLRQNFVFRPFPAVSDYESGVAGLLMTGASTWPGAGVNALSGYNVAQKLLAPSPPRAQQARLARDAARGLGRLAVAGTRRRLRR
ncbi:MAG TPA: NAD(P)/FAD-dependent oxidoreductase [Solirubrobacteraceae bacterium]|nr:NAD(P)/FAD-dependent oxidoreductase [Solirubrobacteraceae bacterium]